MNPSPVCALSFFTQILLFSLLLKCMVLKEDVCKSGKQKHAHLRGMSSLISQASEHRTCFTNRIKKSKHHCLYLGSNVSPHLPLA